MEQEDWIEAHQWQTKGGKDARDTDYIQLNPIATDPLFEDWGGLISPTVLYLVTLRPLGSRASWKAQKIR